MGFTEVKQQLYTVMAPFHGGGNVFLYLLKGDRIALVDTGVTHTPGEVLRPALAEMGLALSDIDLILNTHAHLDHAGGNGEMKKFSRRLPSMFIVTICSWPIRSRPRWNS